jgi:tetratricopeptide (TPR) repeat protein
LKGLYYFNRINAQYLKKGIDYFSKAIELEPDYANAYAMMAACYALLGASGQMQPKEAFAIVHEYGNKALEMDQSLAAGYVAKGAAYLLYDWKWKEAYDALQKAIELNPASTNAYQMLSFYYLITEQPEEAVKIMEQAYEIDPLSPMVNKSLTDAYLFAGRTDESLKQSEILLDLYPKMSMAVELKGWSVGVRGDWNHAAEIFEEARSLNNQTGMKGLYAVGCAYANAGKN